MRNQAIMNLNFYKEAVDKELESFFTKKLEKAMLIDPASVEMIELLKEYTMRGGKRIRAAMVYYGYRCIEDRHNPEILKASMCIELIQSYLLIHDDIIDQDSLRRNGPTLHKSYEAIARKYKADPKHFGISLGILAGDICAAFANEILAKTRLPEKNRLRAMEFMNHTIHNVIYGELLDILSSYRPVTEKSLLQIHRLKTASYTFEGPLHIGAMLAGADEKQLKALSNYANPLGLAFQLQDDMLGLFGDQEKLGKPLGSDLKEGKKTLLIINALENADKSDKSTINKALGNKKLTKKQIQSVQNVMIKTGSLVHCKKLSQDLIHGAKPALNQAKLNSKGKNFLLGIADYMAEREY